MRCKEVKKNQRNSHIRNRYINLKLKIKVFCHYEKNIPAKITFSYSRSRLKEKVTFEKTQKQQSLKN